MNKVKKYDNYKEFIEDEYKIVYGVKEIKGEINISYALQEAYLIK